MTGRAYLWGLLALVGLGALVLLAVPGRQAQAAQMGSELQLFALLNGTPHREGVLTSLDGGLITATLNDTGRPYMVLCQPDSTGHVNIAASCSNSPTAATYCPPIVGPTATYFIPNGSTLAMMPSDAGVISCPYFQMR